MTVKELIEHLQQTNPDFVVKMETTASPLHWEVTSLDESTDVDGSYVILTDYPVGDH